MATETFPSQLLRGPLDASLSRQINEGFNQSEPASGPAYNVRTTFDNEVVYNLEFKLHSVYKQLFYRWVEEKLEGGLKPFNIDIPTEFGLQTQEAFFTSGGTPQLTSIAGDVFTYSARIRMRKLNIDENSTLTYDELEYLLENAGDCGDISDPMNELDIIVNQEWPE